MPNEITQNITLIEAKKQLAKLTDDYFCDLINKFEPAFDDDCPPDKPQASIDFDFPQRYEDFRQDVSNGLTDEICQKLNVPRNNAQSKYIINSFDIVIKHVMQKVHECNESIPTMKMLFINENHDDASRKLLDHLVCVSKKWGSSLSDVVLKLKHVALLRASLVTIDTEQNTNIQDVQQIISQLMKFKKQLEVSNSILKQHRNPVWDCFYNACSFILFPIAACRAINSRLTRGTWNFMWSDGAVMANTAAKIIEYVEPHLSLKK